MAATGIKKLKRSHLMHLLDSTFGGETPSWFLIGKNIEDMSMDLGPIPRLLRISLMKQM